MAGVADAPASRTRFFSFDVSKEPLSEVLALSQDEEAPKLMKLAGVVNELQFCMGMTKTFCGKAELIKSIALKLINAEMFLKVGSRHFFKMVFNELREILWLTDQILTWHRSGKSAILRFVDFLASSPDKDTLPMSLFTALGMGEEGINLIQRVSCFELPVSQQEDSTFEDDSLYTLARVDVASQASSKLTGDDLNKIAIRIKGVREGLDKLAKDPAESAGSLALLAVEVLSLGIELYPLDRQKFDDIGACVLHGMAASHVACTSWLCQGQPNGNLVDFIHAKAGQKTEARREEKKS